MFLLYYYYVSLNNDQTTKFICINICCFLPGFSFSYTTWHRVAQVSSFVCAQKCFWRLFEGEDVKILCSDPEKALPCVNTRRLMYRMLKSVQRPEL